MYFTNWILCQFLLILPTVVETEVPVATIECRQVYEKCMGTRVVDVLKEGFKAKVIQENPDLVKVYLVKNTFTKLDLQEIRPSGS